MWKEKGVNLVILASSPTLLEPHLAKVVIRVTTTELRDRLLAFLVL